MNVNEPIRILELRSVRGTGGGPEKTILLGTARTDRSRYAITVCYVRDARDQLFRIDDRAARLGIDYVEVTEQSSLDPGVWPQLSRLVRDRRIEIVHAHDYKTDLLAFLLARAHGVIPMTTIHGWSGTSRKERAYYAADKLLMRAFPAVVAVSGPLRDEAVRWGARPERVHVVLNAIDPEAFRRDPAAVPEARAALGLVDGEVAIGSVGRLSREKRYDLLLEAFAAVAARRPEARLVIAGEGPERAALETVHTRLGLGERARLLGQREDVTRVHHALDLFVQSSDIEGTPNAVLEAMALGTPVVATDAGGTGEVCRDGEDGLIVPRGDAAALAAAMERALAEPAATARRAAHARGRVETDLSFATRMARVEAIYDALVAAHGRRTWRAAA